MFFMLSNVTFAPLIERRASPTSSFPCAQLSVVIDVTNAPAKWGSLSGFAFNSKPTCCPSTLVTVTLCLPGIAGAAGAAGNDLPPGTTWTELEEEEEGDREGEEYDARFFNLDAPVVICVHSTATAAVDDAGTAVGAGAGTVFALEGLFSGCAGSPPS